jgi:hypothetical protein
MTEENILEGNYLIAKFCGAIGTENYIRNSYNRYHVSWDMLMPVVEKIEHEITPIEILDTQCKIGRTIYNREEILISSDTSKIEATYFAVIEFIKCCNEYKKPNNNQS